MLFSLARLLFVICWFEVAYCGIVLTGRCWPWPALSLAAYIAWRKMHKPMVLTAHGTASWADEKILRNTGMIGGNGGLAVGRLISSDEPGRLKNLASVFNFRLSSKDACERVLSGVCRPRRRKPGKVVRLSNAVHTAVFGPTGMGKGASFIIPWLLETDQSAIVIDYKGENAAITAKHRERVFGHRCVLIDPWERVTHQPDCLNPFDTISKSSETMIDDCRDLAELLVTRDVEERERHWNDSAESWITATIAAVVRFADVENQNLQTVRQVLSDPNRLPKLIELLCSGDGMLARLGSQLAFFRDKEMASVLTSTNRQIRNLDTEIVAKSTTRSTFNPRDLLNGKMTVYLILPVERMRTQTSLMRMWVGTLMRVAMQAGIQQAITNVLADEAASLGANMNCIKDAIDKGRGYGIRLQLYYQSLAQLKECFPNHQDQTVLANVSQVFMGLNDDAAEYVSKRIGEETVLVQSGGTGSGFSTPSGWGTPGNASDSRNSSSNWNQAARRLLKPEEILGLDRRIAITFAPGVPPICTRLERYFEKSTVRKSWFSGLGELIVALFFVLVALNCCLNVSQI